MSDLGEQTYNPLTHVPPVLATHTGTGVAQTIPDPNVSYTMVDSTDGYGYNGAASSAMATPNGSAQAAMGSQEALLFTNDGTSSITFDIYSYVTATGTATAVGPTDYASVTTWAGIYDFNINTGIGVNPLVKINGDTTLGVVTTTTPDFVMDPVAGYDGYYQMTIVAGERHVLEFYTTAKPLPTREVRFPAPPQRFRCYWASAAWRASVVAPPEPTGSLRVIREPALSPCPWIPG